MVALSVAFIELFRTRCAPASIHDVVSDGTDPCIEPTPPAGVGPARAPLGVLGGGECGAKRFIVKSDALLVWITAALTPWKFSSRKYVLLDVTWTVLLPPGCAWS